MNNAGQPESTADRLNRLETLFADMGEVVIAQSEVLSQLGEQTFRNGEQTFRNGEQTFRNTEAIAALGTQTARNASAIEAMTTSLTDIARTAAEGAIQAERDRQVFQAEIQRIWDYLLRQSGNGRQGS